MKPQLNTDDERARRILYRQRILPSQLDRARRRVIQLEAEAIVLSVHNLPELRLARAAGDRIAAEWLRRLGE